MSSKTAAQMFTLRSHTKTAKDLAATLKKVAQIGYPAVQLSGVGAMNGENPEVPAADARKMLDDNGLKCIATHRPWEALRDHTEKEIDFHKTLGCDFAAIGGVHAKDAVLEEKMRQFLAELPPVMRKLKAAGIRFGYHNHAHEFERIAPGPKTVYDLLISEGGADLMLEIDTYWVNHAGADNVALIKRCAGRVPVIHLKDKEVIPGEGPVMAPIGEGNLNWDAILPAFDAAGTEWYAVEQDKCRSDPFDCLKSSFEFLASKGV